MTTVAKCLFSTRLAMFAGALLLASPLVVAARLRPAESGLGTHQQLGLPPCTARFLWNVRCPACGMTTSWAHLVRGQWLESLRANPGGTSLGLVTLGTAVGLISHAVRARTPSHRWFVGLAWGLSVSLAFALVDWGWRLIAGG